MIREMLESGIRLPQGIKEVERRFIELALERSRGNRTAAARLLGIHRNTLFHKIRQLRIRIPSARIKK
ncbi:MAG: helix-turn-helix domain-containing protein [Acidobacteriota bacterium]